MAQKQGTTGAPVIAARFSQVDENEYSRPRNRAWVVSGPSQRTSAAIESV